MKARDGRTVLLLLLPALLLYGLCFVWPTGQMLARSVVADDGGLTGEHYAQLFDTGLYVGVMWTTFRISVITTVICLVLGYPVAMLMERAGPKTRVILLLAVTIPYWLDYIVRTYSWMVLLGRYGFVNQVLMWLGLVDVPYSHLNSELAVLVGTIQVMLPLMILTLFAAMTRIDRTLMDAAAAHGASGLRAFRTVFLPLSMPGVIAGSLLTFVNTLGFYITPALLGGPKQTMISQSIETLSSKLLDWPMAAAASALLLVISLIILALFNRTLGLDRIAGGDA
ncbi:MAG: ABC transporter permease [Rhodobacteraceae bacterium]|nr:ABC transporter permease [Paracoccaceae bacterium]